MPPARARAHRRRSGRRRARHAACRAAPARRSRACPAPSPCQAASASRGTRRRHTRAAGQTCRSSGRRKRLEVEGTSGARRSIVSPRKSSVCCPWPSLHQPDVDARRHRSQPDAPRVRSRPGEPAAAQCPGSKFVCAASGFWRGGPTLYKFLYVQWADMVARPADPCVDSVDRR
ncbi:MAG: hypothetical protein E6J63_13075 [Deltaproteobacteria bacterium]|nr:MAG: hypothetical protein E6J63_13075 [Deltaproteobacteria bacterium]